MQCSEVSNRFVEVVGIRKIRLENGCNVIEFFTGYRDQFVGRGEIVDYWTDTFAANTVVCKASNGGINSRKDTRVLF